MNGSASHPEYSQRSPVPLSRRTRRLFWVILAALLSMLLNPVAATAAAPDQAPLSEVLDELNVDGLRADYVILVDTSSSMEDGRLYGKVKSALRPLLAALSPQDHVSLLTFDTVPAVRYSGPAGRPGDRALGQLPERATGTATDIGAAVDAGIRELERVDAEQVGTLILVTDGEHRPPAGSPYPADTGAGAWSKLAPRAKAVGTRHAVNSFALALRTDTDAGLLRLAFPRTAVAALPDDQIAAYFRGLRDQQAVLKARSLLAGDTATVSVELSGKMPWRR